MIPVTAATMLGGLGMGGGGDGIGDMGGGFMEGFDKLTTSSNANAESRSSLTNQFSTGNFNVGAGAGGDFGGLPIMIVIAVAFVLYIIVANR